VSLVHQLPDHPTDIVGDIHGEYEALLSLLDSLGYGESGEHCEGRKLVFTGDLVDRGEDSPAVMEKVMQLSAAGVARCVLGNHELNILRAVRKGGNDWILDAGSPSTSPTGIRFATTEQRRRFTDFLRQQPIVLEGPHLRIVHACWNTAAVDALRELHDDTRDLGSLYRDLEQQIIDELSGQTAAELKRSELDQHGAQVSDPDWTPQLLPGHAAVELAIQMNNPLRVLTTSEERIAEQPFWAGGKWRMVERCRWWDHYAGEIPVIIGHFWRLFDADARRISGMFGPDVFEGIPSHAWMGENRNVYCVDYSVGQRHLERQQEVDGEFHGKLAALRYPQWQVAYDDGNVVEIGPPGL
jgi:hypothetical protein